MTTIEAYKIDNSFGHYYDFLDIDEEELLYLPLDTRVDQAFHQYFTPSVTSFVKTNLHVAEPKAHETKAEGFFESVVAKSKAYKTYMTVAQTLAELGSYFPSLKAISGTALQYLDVINQPFELLKIAQDVKKVASALLGKNKKLLNNHPKLAQLAFKIGARAFKFLDLMQKFLSICIPGLAAWTTPFGCFATMCSLLAVLIPLTVEVSHAASTGEFSEKSLLSISKLALSCAKKSFEMNEWIQSSRMSEIATLLKDLLKSLTSIATALISAHSLQEDLQAEPEKQDLVNTVPEFLKNNLSLVGKATGNKPIQALAAGMDLIPAGYAIYKEGFIPSFHEGHLAIIK